MTYLDSFVIMIISLRRAVELQVLVFIGNNNIITAYINIIRGFISIYKAVKLQVRNTVIPKISMKLLSVSDHYVSGY